MKKLLLFVSVVFFAVFAVIVISEQTEVEKLKKISPTISQTLPVIVVSAEDSVFEIELYENETAKALLKRLPLTLVMNRWGEGGYGGTLAHDITSDFDKSIRRRAFFKGEVVFRSKKNTLFFFFGSTPIGLTTDTPMLLGRGGIPVGRLKNHSDLEQLSGVVEFSFGIKKTF